MKKRLAEKIKVTSMKMASKSVGKSLITGVHEVKVPEELLARMEKKDK